LHWKFTDVHAVTSAARVAYHAPTFLSHPTFLIKSRGFNVVLYEFYIQTCPIQLCLLPPLSCACYLPRLSDRRDTLCKKVLDKITVPSSRLNRLLPPTRVESHGRELRHSSHFSLFKCRTDRFKNSFFPAMCSRTMNKSWPLSIRLII
jgi:hypothetical protein